MPVTKNKSRQFTFILTEEEHFRLKALSHADAASAAEWIRRLINETFEAQKGRKDLKRSLKIIEKSKHPQRLQFVVGDVSRHREA